MAGARIGSRTTDETVAQMTPRTMDGATAEVGGTAGPGAAGREVAATTVALEAAQIRAIDIPAVEAAHAATRVTDTDLPLVVTTTECQVVIPAVTPPPPPLRIPPVVCPRKRTVSPFPPYRLLPLARTTT